MQKLSVTSNKVKRGAVLRRDMKKNWILYLMVLPVLVYYVVFCYFPMAGIMLAFKDYKTILGNSFFANLMQSEFVGFEHFKNFFQGAYFSTVTVNTFKIGALSILFGFPAPIILALLMNEVKSPLFKKGVQTLSYLPHFISLVVVCGIIRMFVNDSGIVSQFISLITGKEPVNMLLYPNKFVPIYIISDIWQGVGWGSIIYLSALSGVSEELYEAAKIDGAGRWKQTLHVTLPAILPTISIMLILRLGSIINVGYEKIILLYNDLTKPTAEVISTYVYQKGLLDRDYGFSTAVGLFNSGINIIFLMIANSISKKISETSLW